MLQQQTVRVVVEKQRSGCGTALGIMLLIGLAVEYWYISLGILVLVVAVAAITGAKQKQERRRAQAKARHRPGPRDPWLNEVAVALADLDLVEHARNTGTQVGGVPIEGDISLRADRLSVIVTLLATDELARQAELAVRARPETRDAQARGQAAVRAVGRVLYTASGRGGVVDEFRFDEVISVVEKIALPPSWAAAVPVRPAAVPAAAASGAVAAQLGAAPSDILEQLRKLGELRHTGVLTQAEFDAKKGELLRRL